MFDLFNAKVGDRLQIKNDVTGEWLGSTIAITFNSQKIEATCCAAVQGIVEFRITSVEQIP
jgi:hypothetical protein